MTSESQHELREQMKDTERNLSVLAVTAHRPDEIILPFTQADINAEVLSIDTSVNPLARISNAARRTRRALRTHSPDVLLLDCYETVGAPATFMAGQYDIPVVARLVGDPWRKLEEECLQPARKDRNIRRYIRHRTSQSLNEYIFRHTDGFVAVSTDLADVIERRTDCPRDRIGVVPVPITTDVGQKGSAAAARESFGIEEKRVLLTVTNLKFRAKADGIEVIVSDILPLLREDDDLAYIVAGGGKYHRGVVTWLDKKVEDQSVRERIYVPGYVEEVSNLYTLADVFVYVSSLDGYPNVVLEAQTAGLPVVANDAHGMRDQITDGETGFLVDPTERGAIREQVRFLLKEPEERQRLGEQARARRLQENSPEAVGRQLSNVLEEVRNNLKIK